MTSLKQYFLIAILSILTSASFAEVRLPAIVSSNMILQRNTTITIWGWSDPWEKIAICTSWTGKEIRATADKNGRWEAKMETTDSKEAEQIIIECDKSKICLENILFGEVWLCSGQSNMQQSFRGYHGQPTFGAQEAVMKANNDQLRLFTVERNASKTPMDTLDGHVGWELATPSSVKGFSAVAYFYGQQLQEILDVPVGMIHTSWGGSIVEAWTSDDVLSKIDTFDLSEADLKYGNQVPTSLFNAMINPLIPYTIKGALWYQGESNVNEPKRYQTLFPAMVKDWRTRWDIGDFPFYYVQIAPWYYDYVDWVKHDDSAPLMRESQLKCLDLIPNSGMAVLMDIGEEEVIHPGEKKEVANRLLYNALNKTYGYKAVDYSGPVLDTMITRNDTIILKFKHAEQGLYGADQFEGFEIAGKDKVFYPAKADNRWSRIIVKSKEVKMPVAVRYAWKSWIKGTIFDTNLLPASSFRTDDWDDATQFVDPNKKEGK